MHSLFGQSQVLPLVSRGWKINVLLGRAPDRCYVSFKEGNLLLPPKTEKNTGNT